MINEKIIFNDDFFISNNNSMGPVGNLYASDGTPIEGDQISSRVKEKKRKVRLSKKGIELLKKK